MSPGSGGPPASLEYRLLLRPSAAEVYPLDEEHISARLGAGCRSFNDVPAASIAHEPGRALMMNWRRPDKEACSHSVEVMDTAIREMTDDDD